MPGAIRESVKRVFKSVANDPQYRDWTVEEQHARACEIALETNAATNENLPSLDWAYKFLRPFRNYKRWLDDPWSLGTMARSTWTSQMRSGGESDQHDDSQIDVSPEALPHVMWMWRWALARGRRLTNREVFWASRIYPLLLDEGDQLESSVLYRHATDYAREHRASEVLGEPLDTVPLDLQLVTDNQMAVRPWALSESMEQVVLTLVGDLDGINLQSQGYGTLTKYLDGTVSPGEFGWPSRFSPDVSPLTDFLEDVIERRGWIAPSDMHVDLLILGLRHLAKSDPAWGELRESSWSFDRPNHVRTYSSNTDRTLEHQPSPWNTGSDETDDLLNECEAELNVLIDILDEFDILAARDLDVWLGTDEGKQSLDNVELGIPRKFSEPLKDRADEFLDAVGFGWDWRPPDSWSPEMQERVLRNRRMAGEAWRRNRQLTPRHRDQGGSD